MNSWIPTRHCTLPWQVQCPLLRAAAVSAMSDINCVPQKVQHSPTELERSHKWWAGAVIADGSSQSVCRRDAGSHSLVLMLSQPPVEERIFSLCVPVTVERNVLGNVPCSLPAFWQCHARAGRDGGGKSARGEEEMQGSLFWVCVTVLFLAGVVSFPTEEFSRKEKCIVKYFLPRLK